MKTIAKYDLQRQPSPHDHIEPIEPLETTQVQWDNVSLLLTAWRDVTKNELLGRHRDKNQRQMLPAKDSNNPKKSRMLNLTRLKIGGKHLKLAQRS
jgi:hypothetical protein